MEFSLRKMSAKLRICLFALIALVQTMPAGLALASEGDDFTIVICTSDGAKSVSYAELTGEPAPFPSEHNDAGNSCHVCVIGGCASALAQAPTERVKIAPVTPREFGSGQSSHVASLYATGPPLPSRAPPTPVLT